MEKKNASDDLTISSADNVLSALEKLDLNRLFSVKFIALDDIVGYITISNDGIAGERRIDIEYSDIKIDEYGNHYINIEEYVENNENSFKLYITSNYSLPKDATVILCYTELLKSSSKINNKIMWLDTSTSPPINCSGGDTWFYENKWFVYFNPNSRVYYMK